MIEDKIVADVLSQMYSDRSACKTKVRVMAWEIEQAEVNQIKFISTQIANLRNDLVRKEVITDIVYDNLVYRNLKGL